MNGSNQVEILFILIFFFECCASAFVVRRNSISLTSRTAAADPQTASLECLAEDEKSKWVDERTVNRSSISMCEQICLLLKQYNFFRVNN